MYFFINIALHHGEMSRDAYNRSMYTRKYVIVWTDGWEVMSESQCGFRANMVSKTASLVIYNIPQFGI